MGNANYGSDGSAFAQNVNPYVQYGSMFLLNLGHMSNIPNFPHILLKISSGHILDEYTIYSIDFMYRRDKHFRENFLQTL